MAYRFVTPRKNPESEGNIFTASIDSANYPFVFSKELGAFTADKPVFILGVFDGDDQKIYTFSLSDFSVVETEQKQFKAGWYYLDIPTTTLVPIDFYTAFPDGIVFQQISEKPNPTFCETVLFETGTTACKLAVLEETKLLTRLAIVNKGVDVPDGTTFREYAGKIGEINSGGNVKIYDTSHTSGPELKVLEFDGDLRTKRFLIVPASEKIVSIYNIPYGMIISVIFDGNGSKYNYISYFNSPDKSIYVEPISENEMTINQDSIEVVIGSGAFFMQMDYKIVIYD